MNNFKKITGITFLIFGILAILMCLSYAFDWDWFDRDYYIFGKAFDGDSASNSPVFFGLTATTGALLLGQVKEESKVEEDNSLN